MTLLTKRAAFIDGAADKPLNGSVALVEHALTGAIGRREKSAVQLDDRTLDLTGNPVITGLMSYDARLPGMSVLR